MNLVERLRDKGLAFSMFDRDIAADRIEALEAALIYITKMPKGAKGDSFAMADAAMVYLNETALNKGKDQ